MERIRRKPKELTKEEIAELVRKGYIVSPTKGDKKAPVKKK